MVAPSFALFWEPWASDKTAESVVKLVNFRGLTPSKWSLFVGLDRERVLMLICLQFVFISGCFAVHVNAFWPEPVLQIGSRKKQTKVIKNGHASNARVK